MCIRDSIALGYLEQALSDQQDTYDETLEKWNEFSTYIDGNAVCARYNGVITSVALEAGDKISTCLLYTSRCV